MKLLERILVATDFSDGSREALNTAVALAKTFNSEITLIHVISETWDLERVSEAAAERVQELQDEIIGQGVRVGESIVELGGPQDPIVVNADRRDVNVIFVGAKGDSGEDEHPLGITAEKVILKSSKPVWITKPGTPVPAKKILCPVDFSDPSRRALHNAVHLARDLKAGLTVLHVIEASASGAKGKRADTWKAYREQQKTEFEQFIHGTDFSNVELETVTRSGKPHTEILGCAEEMGTDLIVMGSVGRTGLSRLLMGSVAGKVVREVPCSVITVKQEHAIRLQVEAAIADVEERFQEGRALLDEGFPSEAMTRFEYCISEDMMFAPAWEGLAIAHDRMGHEEKTRECNEQAKYIHQKNWERKVEAEIRGELWGKKVSKLE